MMSSPAACANGFFITANLACLGRRLATRAPGRGPAPDRRAVELLAMLGTKPALFPTVREEPRRRWIGIVLRDDAQRAGADETDLSPKSRPPACRDLPGGHARMQLRTPENFIDHPVAKAGEPRLIEQHRLERRAGVPPQKVPEEGDGEIIGSQGRREFRPPGRLALPVMKLDPSKHARVAEDKRLVPLAQHQMIVSVGGECRWFAAELAGHAQMQPQPAIARETEEHLFAMRLRGAEDRPRQCSRQVVVIRASKDSFPSMDFDGEHLLSQPAIPALTKILHFGKFRHGASIEDEPGEASERRQGRRFRSTPPPVGAILPPRDPRRIREPKPPNGARKRL